MKTDQVIQHIVQWLNKYSISSETNGLVVGVSGGIDSAVTSSLAARTGLNTICLEMPIHQAESQESRASKHILQLESNYENVSSIKTDLTPVFDCFVGTLPKTEDNEKRFLSLANSRARLRMTTLYYFAGLNNYLVAGTGNKVEDFGVGFFTKYGDGGVDLSPIADLSKTQVYELGKSLNIIEEIMVAQPTDGLWGDNRTDEDQLGASYDEIEWAMQYDPSKMETLTPRQDEVLKIYSRLHNANKHKMEAIPICKIPASLLEE